MKQTQGDILQIRTMFTVSIARNVRPIHQVSVHLPC